MLITVLFQQALVRSVVTSTFKLHDGHQKWFNSAVSSALCSCLLSPPTVRWSRGSEKRENLWVEIKTVKWERKGKANNNNNHKRIHCATLETDTVAQPVVKIATGLHHCLHCSSAPPSPVRWMEFSAKKSSVTPWSACNLHSTAQLKACPFFSIKI